MNDQNSPKAEDLEIKDWQESISSVIAYEGTERADEILKEVVERARSSGAAIPFASSTAYINTIHVDDEAKLPGDRELERRIAAAIRWNAAVMVLRANKESTELGGHIASYQSAATLYEVGFNHFWHAPTESHGGDLVLVQGHSSPGIYARAFVEGRLEEDQILNFRKEVGGHGLSSYPHPWLMPDFWQFPTVSMGLGPLMAIYQARFLKYLHARGLADSENRKVWVFCGDGEMDEPESLGAISLAGREKLDNLIFVINCNLQRLDGPVRGNGKIIQELERNFRGAGWNVIKVIWGSQWDELLARDTSGKLRRLMEECVDGEYQVFKSRDGAFIRKNFFGRYPETAALVEDWPDEKIWRLTRGGHDPSKVYAAYAAAVSHEGQPTCILAKTVKGYGMGAAGEATMLAHQSKKMDLAALRQFRDRFKVPVTDLEIEKLPLIRFREGSPEHDYLHQMRRRLGGYLPVRRRKSVSLDVPPLSLFESQLKGSDEREISTTMAFVRILTALMRDKELGRRIVPIVPDESRTFGMEGMFRQFGIFSQVGQLYRPQDADQLMFYKEDKHGQMLQEGINEAGAMASWMAAATSYATSNVPMVPFFIFYSMFGFQRFGDLAWAAGDERSRGFLLGGTSGRTTLNGEGLQHEDGHSHILASTVPNCLSYDPAFSYEVAVIIHSGLKRMLTDQEDVYFYITLLNENYEHPPMPEGAEAGIIKGMYLFREAPKDAKGHKVQLMGSGAILREVIAAADLLRDDWGVAADIWSVTSFTELARQARDTERWNLLHPTEIPRVPYVTEMISGRGEGPVIASTDYVKLFADQIRTSVPNRYSVLGTDGFGRSDLRRTLRSFFEVDRHFVAIAALKALADENKIPSTRVADAIAKYGIDPEKPNPSHS